MEEWVTAVFLLLPELTQPFAIMHDGRAISSLPCNQGFVVSDSAHYSPPAAVTFYEDSARIAFQDSTRERRTLFVYVDGVVVALISAEGPVTILAPLGRDRHHKIVSGTAMSGMAIAATSDCI